jgi:hypothetical protein
MFPNADCISRDPDCFLSCSPIHSRRDPFLCGIHPMPAFMDRMKPGHCAVRLLSGSLFPRSQRRNHARNQREEDPLFTVDSLQWMRTPCTTLSATASPARFLLPALRRRFYAARFPPHVPTADRMLLRTTACPRNGQSALVVVIRAVRY